MDRQLKTKYFSNYEMFEDGMKAQELLDAVLKFKNEDSEAFKNADLCFSGVRNNDPKVGFEWFKKILETDEEINTRIAIEKRNKEERRKNYLELKKEFENE